ncbi:PAAR domain-containing protein [soil metagenome]
MAARSNLYGRAQALKGDMTSHGGVVLSGSATSNWYGIPIARKGDGVYCPKCKPHFFKIEEGLSNCIDRGAEMAGEGHLTTCGAKLIAQTAPPSLMGAAIAASGGKPADHGITFDRFFLVKDKATGKGKPDIPYKITLGNGDVIEGVTDASGHTQKVYSDKATTAKLEAPYYGNDNSTAHPAHGSDACGC